jgi:dihydroorotase-like cyclic amidohydrolase
MIPPLDLIVRNCDIATAADRYRADIGVREGRIALIAEHIDGAMLAPGGREIDAAGRLVTPGGVDSHCHIDQPTNDGSVCADDFRTGTASAAAGGTTTIIPFACQFRGQSLIDVLADYHRRADGKALVDYAFHMILSDPTEQVVGSELTRLVAQEGVTSFKIYMTYDDLKLDDGQIIRALAAAKRERAMTMVHPVADRATARGGYHRADRSCAVAPAAGRARGHAPCDQPRRIARCADPARARFGARGDRADSLGPGSRTADLWRDLPPLSAADRRGAGRRTRRRALHLQPAAA